MADEPDIFTIDAQAELLTGFVQSLPAKCHKFLAEGDENALDALHAIDAMGDAMRRAKISNEYITAVESIKDDPEVKAAVALLDRSLHGKANVDRLARDVPNPEPISRFVAFRDDPGVKREVLTGQDVDGETDVIRFSNYITGPGTTVGGAAVSLPLNLAEIALAFNNAPLYRYFKTAQKLKEANHDLVRYIDGQEREYRITGRRPDVQRRLAKPYTIQLIGVRAAATVKDGLVTKEPFYARKELYKRQRLLMKDLEIEKRKRKSRFRGQKRFGLIGTGVQGVTSTYGIANGVVDIVAGDQMMDNADRRFQNGEIDEEKYNLELRNAHFRVAQGSFGIGDGINNLRRIAMDKLKDKVAGLRFGLRQGLRFASVVGGGLSLIMGVTAVAKHSMAAHDALKEGQYYRGVMYGIMAAMDTISVILDGVSMALDCIPGIGTALSVIVDVINTLVDFANLFIGFFVDMCDQRTDEELIKEAFKSHVKSDAFQSYINRQAQVYKDQNYDLFEYIIDAKALGLDEEGVDSSKIDHSVLKKLSDKAVADATDVTLRKAIMDESSVGRALYGNLSDDLILAGAGGDTLYGLDGDDLLFGEAGNDSIYGGPGNDYLNGGTSADSLFGGKGDDHIVYEPGIDSVADGGDGTDTIQISANFFAKNPIRHRNALVLEEAGRNRVYVDLRPGGRGGLALGALLDSFHALSNPMHQPAFTAQSTEAIEVEELYESGTESNVLESSLDGLYFWYLAMRSAKCYLTDGRHIYSCTKTTTGQIGTFKKSSYSIDSISASLAVYNDGVNVMEYAGNSKLKAIFAFAFRRASSIVNVENVSVRFSSDSASAVDTSCQVIGGPNTWLIESSSGDNTYIYTGNSNTVVLVRLSISSSGEVYKYIIGGSGSNTLVLNGSHSPAGYSIDQHQVILLDHDVNFAEANRERNEANGSLWYEKEQKVNRGIFLKNVQTIKFSNVESDYCRRHFWTHNGEMARVVTDPVKHKPGGTSLSRR